MLWRELKQSMAYFPLGSIIGVFRLTSADELLVP